MGGCRLCERKRRTECMGVCLGYVKGRERGTEWVGVGYVKGREGQSVWMCV